MYWLDGEKCRVSGCILHAMMSAQCTRHQNTWNKEMHHPIHIEPLSSLQVQVPIGHTFDQPTVAWKPLAATNTSYSLFPPLQGIHNFKLIAWPYCSLPASPWSWDRRTRAKARFVLFCRFLGGKFNSQTSALRESWERQSLGRWVQESFHSSAFWASSQTWGIFAQCVLQWWYFPTNKIRPHR